MTTFQIFFAFYVVAPAGCFAALVGWLVGWLPITAQKNEVINTDSFAVTLLSPFYGDIGLFPYLQLKMFGAPITS